MAATGKAGDALRARLAAQADAAFASGSDNPLRQLVQNNGETRADRWEQAEAGASLLLTKPAIESRALQIQDELDLEALKRAAENGDLKALAQMDKRLKKLLDADERMQILKEGDLSDPAARDALRLYRESLMHLESGGHDWAKEACQAVARDDSARLRELLNKGVSPKTQNAGGSSLLQLARERNSVECMQILVDIGESQ
eukprot:TRINITY_DN5192_c0_g2_i1.p1 TRINITY_DN5192_c0_g2~~TRINITY_DN5192_c0_g2_i1.p1  ORF type:complete len:201 (+),score=45.74 TRINITY_DN5192_c0_g2_i1:130-732(+)